MKQKQEGQCHDRFCGKGVGEENRSGRAGGRAGAGRRGQRWLPKTAEADTAVSAEGAALSAKLKTNEDRVALLTAMRLVGGE